MLSAEQKYEPSNQIFKSTSSRVRRRIANPAQRCASMPCPLRQPDPHSIPLPTSEPPQHFSITHQSIESIPCLVEGKTDGSTHGPVHLNVDLSLGGGDGTGLRGGEGGLGSLIVAGNGGGVNVVELYGLGTGDVLWSLGGWRETKMLVRAQSRRKMRIRLAIFLFR